MTPNVVSDGEMLWRQICKSASVVEIISENGAKMERCQLRDASGATYMEVIRAWRAEPVDSTSLTVRKKEGGE